MKISRRDFFAHSSSFLLSFAPILNTKTSPLNAWNIGKTTLPDDQNILLVIHLAGGNDWFNTVVPYNDPAYYKLRPNLALKNDSLLKLNDQFALHPALAEIKTAFDKNEVAILLNCDSKTHDLSHQKAIKQCQYLNAGTDSTNTWQQRYIAASAQNLKDRIFPAINVEPIFYRDPSTNEIKSKEKLVFSLLKESNGFAFDLDIHYRALPNTTDVSNTINTEDYIENGFESAMQQTAALINQKSNAAIYHISLGGFDTHENQLESHELLLDMLSKGILSFRNALKKSNMTERVLLVVCSEFGRTLKENDTRGTDHDYINHALVLGKAINGGIYESSLSTEQNHQTALAIDLCCS